MKRAVLFALLSACADAALPSKPTAWANRDAGASPAITAPKLAWSFRQNDCRAGSIPMDMPSPSPLPIVLTGGGCPQKTNGPGAKTYLNARQGASVTSSSAPGNTLKAADASSSFTDAMVAAGLARTSATPNPTPAAAVYVETILTVQAPFSDGEVYRLFDVAAPTSTNNGVSGSTTMLSLDYTKTLGESNDGLTLQVNAHGVNGGQGQCILSEVASNDGYFSILEYFGNSTVGETWLIGVRLTTTNWTYHIGRMGTELSVELTSSFVGCPSFAGLRMTSSTKFRLGGPNYDDSIISSTIADYHWFAIYGGLASSTTLPTDFIIQQHAYAGLPNSNPVGRQNADSYVWIANENSNTTVSLNDTLSYFDQDSDSPKLFRIVSLPTAGKFRAGGADVAVDQLVTSGETLVFEPAANGFSKAYDGSNTCTSSYATFTYRLSDDICDGIATGSSDNCMLPTDITGTLCVRETNVAPQATVTPFSLQVETNADFSVQCVDSDTTIAQLGLSKLTIVSQSRPELGSLTLDTCFAGGSDATLPVDIAVSPTPAANVAKTFNLCYRAKPNAGAVTPTVTPSSTDVITVRCVDKLNAQTTVTISVGLTDPNPPTGAPTIPTLAPTTKAPVVTRSPTGPTVPTTEAPTNADGSTGPQASTSSAAHVLPSALASVAVFGFAMLCG